MNFRDEFETSTEKLVYDLSFMVNCADDKDLRDFAIQISKDHRTLVQKKMKLVMYFIEELAKQLDANHYDLRNEAACKLAKKITTTFDKYERYMPHI